MKKILVFIIAFQALQYVLDAQIVNSHKDPDVQIHVNVERDDNGNIIRYDSTYVKTWSSDASQMEADSLSRYFDMHSRIPSIDDFFSGDPFFDRDENFFPPSHFDAFDSLFFGTNTFFPDMKEFRRRMHQYMREMQMTFPPDTTVNPPKFGKQKIAYKTYKI
jgi:hypothetical protein